MIRQQLKTKKTLKILSMMINTCVIDLIDYFELYMMDKITQKSNN